MPRTRSEWRDDEPVMTREVHTEERDTFTGLYNAQGEPLHRPSEKFGFQPDRWSMAKKKRGGKRKC